MKSRKVDRNWSNWVARFLINVGVITMIQPWKVSLLFQYFDTMFKASTGFLGHVWFQYDEEFRMWTAVNSALQWD